MKDEGTESQESYGEVYDDTRRAEHSKKLMAAKLKVKYQGKCRLGIEVGGKMSEQEIGRHAEL